ncbi:MAG: NADH:flavin oxidoreductase [Clostridia bacterium]
MFNKIESPVVLGGLTLKNRIVLAPMSMEFGSEEYLQTIKRIADGGCAMMTIGDVSVAKKQYSSIYNKDGVAYYQKLIAAAHENGCKISAQLYYPEPTPKGLLRYIPDILTKKITKQELNLLRSGKVPPYINLITKKKINAITASFGEAAVLAKRAGFDMVQVHGDKLCGRFSSSIFNQRTDEYGGSAVKRAGFAVEVVSAIRKALADFPIDYKLAVRQENPHYGNAGVLLEELPEFIPLLEKAGVTSFHVTLGGYAALSDTLPPKDHPCFSEEGCFLRYCDEVRKYTSLPISGVGGLTTPGFIEAQLECGRIECAAMGRQLVADPEWPNKAFSGREQEIRHCIRCNRTCLADVKAHCIFDDTEK